MPTSGKSNPLASAGMRYYGSTLLLAGVFALIGCDRETTAPPDRTPPTLNVTSPSAAGYDDTSGGLVDVRVTWPDTSDVDLQLVQVRSLRKVSGIAEVGANLLEYWHVERLDSMGMVLHERKEFLLPQGENRLVIIATDIAGNETVDTVALRLPYAELTKRLISGWPDGFLSRMVKGTYCADENRIYMTTYGTNVLVLDPDSAVIGEPFSRWPSERNTQVLCIPGDPVLYVTDTWVHHVDRHTYGNAVRVEGSFGSTAMVQSRANPDIIYVGEIETAGVALISRSANRRIGEIPIPWSTRSGDFVGDLAVLPQDEKIYVTRGSNGGILVVDPVAGVIQTRITLTNDTANFGRTDDIELTRDASTLYAAVLTGSPRGVARIDTRTDEITARLALTGEPQHAQLSPDERRMFVTTQDLTLNHSPNYLVDVVNWRVLQEFPRPRPDGAFRFDGPVVFHPSGRWFFVGHNFNVNVYLNRE